MAAQYRGNLAAARSVAVEGHRARWARRAHIVWHLCFQSKFKLAFLYEGATAETDAYTPFQKASWLGTRGSQARCIMHGSLS